MSNQLLTVNKKERDSNFELLRIVLQFFILTGHYLFQSGLFEQLNATNEITFNNLFLSFFGAWGKTAINCFVLITGYFMCKSKITSKKFVKLLFEIMFYNILIGLIFMIVGKTPISITTLVSMLVPIANVQDYFVGAYIIFFLFIPFLNLLINNVNKKQHFWLVVLLVFVFCVWETLAGAFETIHVGSNYIVWFSVLYVVAAYVRLYPSNFTDSKKLAGLCSIVCLILSMLSIFVMKYVLKKDAYFFLIDSQKILAFATAFFVFLYFKNLKVKQNKFINVVASASFGVLLISSNATGGITWFIWENICHNSNYFASSYLVLHAIGCCVIVYTICTLVELLRLRFIEKPVLRLYDNIETKIKDKKSKVETNTEDNVSEKENDNL